MYVIFVFILFLNKFVFKICYLFNIGFSFCDDGNYYYLYKGGWCGIECFCIVLDSICDRYIFSNMWYKVIGYDDFELRKIVVGLVDMFKCGIDYLFYLVNGKFFN